MLYAQKDSLRTSILDSFLLNQKGLVGQLTQSLLTDTTDDLRGRKRNDEAYQMFRGRTIRHIIIKQLDFGVSIGDTNKVINNKLTRLAKYLHWETKENEIIQNLFFRPNDKLSPYLLGDNERYLRDLPYLQDARIKVLPVRGKMDSVDVFVYTKDVISVGGDMEVHNTKSAAVTLKEDNFYGMGDRFQVQMLYEQKRHKQLGYGFEYIRRNIKGTFIDAAAGYLNFGQAFSSGKSEERMGYIRFNKQMVNPYIRWTYALDARISATRNMYATDSFYDANINYRTQSLDAWAALNTSAGKIAGRNEDNRLRVSLSLRSLYQRFTEKPIKYNHQYYYQYADLTAILAALSIFKQNFYKIQYLYGFGRPEDIPQGIDATLKVGWTVKDQRRRPYVGLDLQRFFFSASEQYFDLTLQLESFLYKRDLEDVNLLGRVSFINHVHNINSRWKQRTLLSAEFVKQFSGLLNEPVYPQKLYGALRFSDHLVGGNMRANINGESVFYSPWSILYFKLAPFAFGDASLFRYHLDHSAQVELFTAVGGGIRLRNESLILGTIDIRGWYFPNKNYNHERFNIEFRTKVRFTYNQKFDRRPEFIRLN